MLLRPAPKPSVEPVEFGISEGDDMPSTAISVKGGGALIPARGKYPKIGGQTLGDIVRKSNKKMKEFLEEHRSEAETKCQELLEALIRDGQKCTLEKLEHVLGMGRCDLNFIRTQTVEYLQHLWPIVFNYIKDRLIEADPFQEIGDGLRQLIKMHKEGEIKDVNGRRVITTSVETSPSPHNVKQQAMSSIRSSATPEDSRVDAPAPKPFLEPAPSFAGSEGLESLDKDDYIETLRWFDEHMHSNYTPSSNDKLLDTDAIDNLLNRDLGAADMFGFTAEGSRVDAPDEPVPSLSTTAKAPSPTAPDAPQGSFAAKFSSGVGSPKKRHNREQTEPKTWVETLEESYVLEGGGSKQRRTL